MSIKGVFKKLSKNEKILLVIIILLLIMVATQWEKNLERGYQSVWQVLWQQVNRFLLRNGKA